MLDTCLQHGPQVVTRRGVDSAVLVPLEQWQRLQAAKPTLKALLLAPEPRADFDVPPRGQQRRRPPVAFS